MKEREKDDFINSDWGNTTFKWERETETDRDRDIKRERDIKKDRDIKRERYTDWGVLNKIQLRERDIQTEKRYEKKR